MKRVWLVSLLSGCSLLFDPSRVPESDCPASPRRCPERANATAVCVEASCGFTCAEGFRDADGLADNGCEASCTEVPGPTRLTSISGGSATSLRWEFPSVDGASAYQLCTGVAAGSRACVTVPVSACSNGVCEVETPGLAPSALVFGQVQSLGACQNPSSEASAAGAEGFTFVTTGLQAWAAEANCMPPTVTTTADTLAVEQPAFCTSTVSLGDERWRDGTFEVDLRFSGQLGGEVMAGIVLSSGSRRLAITTGTAALGSIEAPTQIRESLTGQAFVTLASSIATVPAERFERLRVVVSGPLISVNVGPPTGPLREVIRFHDDRPSAPRRLGLITWSAGRGRVEFQGLTARSAAALPARGITTQAWRFQADGGASGGVRLLKAGEGLRFERCPSFTAACPECGVPPAEACARIQRVPFVSGGSITVDPPVGIDTTTPWSFRLRVAPPRDGGALLGVLAQGPSEAITGARTSWADGGVIDSFGREWPATLTEDRWHLIEHTFQPDAGTFSLRVDGQPLTLSMPAFPARPRANKHVGAVTVGGGLFIDVWIGEISFSQP
jgi:hypothetical protein